MNQPLRPMCDYLLDLGQDHYEGEITDAEFVEKAMKYRNFLRRELRLSMFVPCDPNGMPLNDTLVTREEYSIAMEKVLLKASQ